MAITRGIDVPVRAVYEDGTRVLLARPGDVLLIGNVGDLRRPDLTNEAISTLGTVLGVKVFVFAGDIDISKVPADA